MSQVIDNWSRKTSTTSPSPYAWPDVQSQEEPQWPVSDMWPFDLFQQRVRASSGWEFEPSGCVGRIEILVADDQATADAEFNQEKDAFKRIPPLILMPYRGQFVASRNGEIVDSDDNLAELTRRFFGEHGDVSVYITRVGEPIRITISTPLFR
jgi:hypothetical protein